MAYKAMNVDDLLQLMKKIQGEKTDKEFAGELGVSNQYLCDIYHRRRDPGESVLTALGVQRVISYVPSSSTAAMEKKNNDDKH